VREAGFAETGEAIRKFIERPADGDDIWKRQPAFEPWRAYREQLHTYPDTPLPSP
jgi:hypothetical protein